MRHPLPLAAIEGELDGMDPNPCGVPHHRMWEHGGHEQSICPDPVRRNRVRCLHSNNAVLRAGAAKAAEFGLMTAQHAERLGTLLVQDIYGPAWTADMLAVKIGNVVHANASGLTYDVLHVQDMTGIPRNELRMETLGPERAKDIVVDAQARATQWREDVRQALLSLFRSGQRNDAAIDALIARGQLQVS